MRKYVVAIVLSLLCCVASAADREVYLKHSGGLLVGKKSDGRAGLVSKANAKKLKLRDVGGGYYLVVWTDANGAESYMTLNGGWNTYFENDATTDLAKYAIEGDAEQLFLLKNKSNGKYLGTDSNDEGANLYSDKNGSDTKHYWFISDDANAPLPKVVTSYIVAPTDLRQENEGWGVSLCWWARMCGEWSDRKIDQLVDWLVSPTGLNYNIFRYNIGGGDDPENKNCTKHHMGNGKGLRAEMDGFKAHSEDEYDWTKDAGQRKIMLKIKEKRPDAIFEAFSNSAPYYMTYSGCVAGNVDGGKDNLKPEYYEEFAHYLVDVCKHYKDEYGIEFKTLEPFNEATTNFWHANGQQEGCHFDNQSQINFIKVLAPILKESGLNTIISASDETNVGGAVGTFEAYKRDGKALSLVGQWNTHTYGADDVSRNRLGLLARSEGKTLWMSETGSGGNGIGGNLNVAQRMFDDIRGMLPAAWIDWQYVEENNDQWCTVKGSFSNQTCERVKNYYVRQQVTSHIKQGYRFVTSLSPQSLAAVNAACDTLVLVTLNTGASSATHTVKISGCMLDGTITCYQTTAAKNHQKTTTGFTVKGDVLTLSLPATSITTYIIPIKGVANEDKEIKEDVPYLIMPQYNAMAALTADKKNVSIEQVALQEEMTTPQDGVEPVISVDAAQTWMFEKAGNNLYYIVNGNGEILTSTSGYALTTQTKKSSGQLFKVESIDGVFVKITNSSNSKSLDLSNAAYKPGTQVGLWDYGSNITEAHRNWYLCKLDTFDENALGIENNLLYPKATSYTLYNINGMRAKATAPGIYILRGADGTSKKIIKR